MLLQRFCLVSFFALAASRLAAQAPSTGLAELRAQYPAATGSGVRVAQAEAVLTPNGNDFEVNPSAAGQTASFFTYQSSALNATSTFPNAAGTESSHADQVGALFYGKVNTANPEGVAYGVSHVDNFNATYFYNSLIALGGNLSAKVVNQSFIFSGQNATIDQKYDNYVALHGTIFSSGIGNGGAPNSSSTAYNCLAVAAYGGSSSVGPTSDGRSKPDLTAPASATSFSTPQVAGAAAILVQAGNALPAGTAASAVDPRTVKALLLNGATKQIGWTHTSTAPLDKQQGAGVVNIFNAYQQLAAGLHAKTTTNTSQVPPSVSGSFPTLTGWDFTTVSTTAAADQVNHYLVDLSGGNGVVYTLTSTLVWNRQNTKTTINNLDLFLYNAAGTLVVSSVSAVDNVEHLFTSYLPPGRYDLEVVKRAAAGTGNVSAAETYALAFRFETSAPLSATISTVENDVHIDFPSITGHTYRVQESPDLSPNSWTTLSDNIAGTGAIIPVVDANALGDGKKFYRVMVLP